MIVGVAVGEVRPGYELWRPNREKAESITTKFVLVFLLLATAALAALITITGFSLMTGGGGMGIVCLIYARPLRLLRLPRLPLEPRHPAGRRRALDDPGDLLRGRRRQLVRPRQGRLRRGAAPVPLIGLLVVILALLQIVLIAVALYGFNQDWHVEEERPIGSGEDYGAGAAPAARRAPVGPALRAPDPVHP